MNGVNMFDLVNSRITKCQICGKLLSDAGYLKDEYGRGIYWANPAISYYTDFRVDFCSAEHSTQWFIEQIEARKNVTPDI
jgi:hypothetical protein